MSRVTTPGLTARRVSPRVTHSFPPALAATKKHKRRGEGKRVDVDALAWELAYVVANSLYPAELLLDMPCGAGEWDDARATLADAHRRSAGHVGR